MEPNFFIVGAPKSATTNMSYYLKQHPQVFMPENLEPYYFARLDIPENYQREIISDKKKYLDLYKKATNHKAAGESSPVYLYCPHAAEDIRTQFPNSRIIISLRNPIEITDSQYYSLKFMKFNASRSFDEILDVDEKQIERDEFHIDNLLIAGFYTKHIKRFQKIFPEDRIKIVIFEEYIKNIIPTINSILKFLDINESTIFSEQPKGAFREPRNSITKSLLENSVFRKIVQKTIPTVPRQKVGERFFVKESQKPSMNKYQRERLKKIFQQDVKDLEDLLGRKLPWPDFN
ncbi:MAG: sulfotransferase [Thaumarchaeota archaeon]|nr:sulfotransferase [Nitrososphaerota archaeon]